MAAAIHAATEVQQESGKPVAQAKLHPEVILSDPSTDDLVFRFWQLRADLMRDIALRLELITEADLKIKPHQRYYKAFELAKEKGLLVDLAREVAKHEQNQ
jgi:hypothetical protein